MNFARFFVTAVILVTSVVSVGCGDKKKAKTDPAAITALRNEGKAKWEDTELLTKELAQTYRILILDMPFRHNKLTIDGKLMGQKFNWGRLTLSERQAAKEKLAAFITSTSRIIEIDAKKGVYVTHMDKVRSRYASALAFQTSLNLFEQNGGESFEPKNPGQGPIYFAPIDM